MRCGCLGNLSACRPRSDRSSGHSTVTERTDSPRYAASMTEPSLPDEILDHYANRKDEDARLRGGQGRLEFARVQENVRRNLPEGPQRILDVGVATGVHAEWLLADGHQVHLIDPVPSHVARATESLGRTPRSPPRWATPAGCPHQTR